MRRGRSRMTFDKSRIRAVVFDYGNTLVQFGRPEIAICDAALAEALERMYGPLDRDKVRAVRDRNRVVPYQGDPPEYRENDLARICADLVREVYGLEPSAQEVEEMMRVRFDVFLEVIEVSESVVSLLDRLKAEYRLGLLSNYPSGDTIRASLAKEKLASHFDAVVISGDVGFIKPHPIMFRTALEELGVRADEALVVGDNWLADIQGAKRAGMYAALTVQWEEAERFEPQPGDIEPDFTIAGLSELDNHISTPRHQ